MSTWRCAWICPRRARSPNRIRLAVRVGHGQGNLDRTVIVADGTPVDDMWQSADTPDSVPPPNLPPSLCRSEFPPQQCVAWGL